MKTGVRFRRMRRESVFAAGMLYGTGKEKKC